MKRQAILAVAQAAELVNAMIVAKKPLARMGLSAGTEL
jgi:hypothetical protein